MPDYLLAGDVGGTKTNLTIFEEKADGSKSFLAEGHYLNRDNPGIAPIVRRFLDAQGIDDIALACFGVAGAVNCGICYMPNLGWLLKEEELAEELGLQRVFLINDLVATAYGINELAPDQLLTLNAGKPNPEGNKALIAAGTGLGQAMLFETEHGLHIAASEGGHADFAPNNPLEVDLWHNLSGRFGHVSVERVISGAGLHNIYHFLRDSGRYPESESQHAAISAASDASATIAEMALHKKNPLCEAALYHFVAMYGAEAGNLALKTLATGGIYIGGGIAPKILDALTDGTFVTAFMSKGRFTHVLSNIPVKIIMEPKTALLGAAAFIARHA